MAAPCQPRARWRRALAVPRCQRSLDSPAPGDAQFTFACFCGLHGFCKMKRKKEEAGGGQETAV
ncbi:bladder cancer associated transcript 1 [Ammospiza nelsoni]|uniref:bladder cancer associated transcript 1 n=1 Tax=Ammospiza nelsoni TaxID=2857394 RepID=UPI00286A9272|nr:bladder cancer associated transcript 1 [Ammospiza nelsoni]